jgi:methyl-accepting chemotaxis protein
MKLLANMSIGLKLLVAPLAVLTLLLLLAVSSLIAVKKQQAIVEDFYQTRFEHSKKIGATVGQMQRSLSLTYELLASANANYPIEQIEKIGEKIKKHLDDPQAIFAAWLKEADLHPEERKLIENTSKLLAEYRKQVADVIEIAKVDYATAVPIMSIAQQGFDKLAGPVDQLLALEDKLGKDAFDEAQAASERTRTTLIVIVVVSVLVAIGVTLLVRNATVASLSAIRRGAEALQSGDLTQRVAAEGRDEIAATAKAFNALIDNFQQAVRVVLDEANEVARAADAVSRNSQQASAGTAAQAESSSSLAATMEELSVSINSISDTTKAVRESARSSLQNTSAGSDALKRMTVEIGQVGEAFHGISASVGEFVSSTKAITDLTHKVKDIAEQTNLLALNAAIEAARAGEQGRGFAVVADEVRKLAEKSSAAAVEIESVTRSLQTQSGGVEQSLDGGKQSIATSEGHLAKLRDVVELTGETANQTDSGVEEIAGAVAEQSSASHDIARNVDNIARMTEQNSELLRETSRAAEQLRQHAQTLQSAVGRFRT